MTLGYHPRASFDLPFRSQFRWCGAGGAGARPHGRIRHARLALDASPRPSLVLAGALQSGKSMFPRLIPDGEGRLFNYLIHNKMGSEWPLCDGNEALSVLDAW